MAGEQVTASAEGGKTRLHAPETAEEGFKKVRKSVDEVLCELQFIRDGFEANNGLTPNGCNEFAITGGVKLLSLTINKLDGVIGSLDELEQGVEAGREGVAPQ